MSAEQFLDRVERTGLLDDSLLAKLRKQVASMTREVEDIKQQNRELENKTAQNWFLIGGGVVVGGILLGLILPHLRVRRRKSSWGSL